MNKFIDYQTAIVQRKKFTLQSVMLIVHIHTVMNIIEAVYSKRTVRYFDVRHRFTEDAEKQMLEVTVLSPASFNIQQKTLIN